jgi:hypothetical protein
MISHENRNDSGGQAYFIRTCLLFVKTPSFILDEVLDGSDQDVFMASCDTTPCTFHDRNLVDPASSHMLVSKIKPCMSKYKHFIL